MSTISDCLQTKDLLKREQSFSGRRPGVKWLGQHIMPKIAFPLTAEGLTRLYADCTGHTLLSRNFYGLSISVFSTVSLRELFDIRVILNVLVCSEDYVDISHMALSLVVPWHDLHILSADVLKNISLWRETVSTGCHRVYQNFGIW